MDNNSNFPQNPGQPPNQNPNPPYNPYDRDVSTRKTLYLVAFIFSILTTILIGLSGLITLIQGLVFLGIQSDETTFGIFAIAYIISGAICLSLLIWLIIATVLIGRYRLQVGTKDEKQHLAFAICALIFGNLVSGILLIIANSMLPKS